MLFAADLIFWHHAIANVGAGMGTVLGNLQVAIVPFLAWFALGEHPGRRVLPTLPLVLIGIVLISGVLEHGAYGADPGLGVVFGVLTGLSYAAFILVLRAGGARPAAPRRPAVRRHPGRRARRSWPPARRWASCASCRRGPRTAGW